MGHYVVVHAIGADRRVTTFTRPCSHKDAQDIAAILNTNYDKDDWGKGRHRAIVMRADAALAVVYNPESLREDIARAPEREAALKARQDPA